MRELVIADLHFGDHPSASARRALVADHTAIDNEIIQYWNATVSDADTVYVLGDVGRRYNAARVLRGQKHLVAGNRDDLAALHRSGIFASISVARWLPDVLLTHIPVHPSQLRRGTINVHGHLHAQEINDERYVCASIEHIGLAPVPLHQFVARRASP